LPGGQIGIGPKLMTLLVTVRSDGVVVTRRGGGQDDAASSSSSGKREDGGGLAGLDDLRSWRDAETPDGLAARETVTLELAGTGCGSVRWR